MITPMMIQYLVGLCCLRHNPDAVNITLGDFVYDEAAQKERDVDVTITLQGKNGSVTSFKAVEVKDEKKPIGVQAIEQLCMKLDDMPKVSEKIIFSTSDYSEGAKA